MDQESRQDSLEIHRPFCLSIFPVVFVVALPCTLNINGTMLLGNSGKSVLQATFGKITGSPVLCLLGRRCGRPTDGGGVAGKVVADSFLKRGFLDVSEY